MARKAIDPSTRMVKELEVYARINQLEMELKKQNGVTVAIKARYHPSLIKPVAAQQGPTPMRIVPAPRLALDSRDRVHT